MKKTIKTKFELLVHLSGFSRLTKVSLRELRKRYSLGYPSLIFQILESSGRIDIKKEGGLLAVRWIGDPPSYEVALWLHKEVNKELRKRYPGKFGSKLEKAAEKAAEKIKSVGDTIGKLDQKKPVKAEQLFLNFDDRSSEEQIRREALQRLKIRLLSELQSVAADFSKKIKEISKEIASLSVILLLLLPGCKKDYEEAERLEVRSCELSTAPDSCLSNYDIYLKMIAGEIPIDDLPRELRREIYVLRYKDEAIKEYKRAGVLPSIKLGQALIESGEGLSLLARDLNNHFGIKCFSRTCSSSHCANYRDDSHKDFFRRFKTVGDSYRAHSEFLKKERYRPVFKAMKKKDYRESARELSSCGYATDPNYSRKLIGIIESFELWRYDRGEIK